MTDLLKDLEREIAELSRQLEPLQKRRDLELARRQLQRGEGIGTAFLALLAGVSSGRIRQLVAEGRLEVRPDRRVTTGSAHQYLLSRGVSMPPPSFAREAFRLRFIDVLRGRVCAGCGHPLDEQTSRGVGVTYGMRRVFEPSGQDTHEPTGELFCLSDACEKKARGEC